MPRSLVDRGHFSRFASRAGAGGVLLALLLSVPLAAAQATPPSTAPVSSSSASPPVANPSTQPNAPTGGTPPTGTTSSAPSPPDAPVQQSTSTQTDTANSPAGESSSTEPAPTPEQEAEAQAAVAQGQAAYAAGDYTSAETQFRQAMAIAPSAEAQYGLAMALDLQGKPTEAFLAFEALFQMSTHSELPAEQVAAATQRHAVLKSIPATVVVQVTGDPAASEQTPETVGAQLMVDGVTQTGAPPFTLKLAAGEHELVASAPGYETQTLKVTVRPAESSEQTLVLTAIEEPAPATAAQPPLAADRAPVVPLSVNKTPAFVTLGVAGAAAVVGTVFGVQALGAKDRFEDDPTVAHADDVERNALIADMAFGIAFTLGVTGAVLLLADEPPTDAAASTRSSTRTQTALHLVPFVSRHSGGAAAHLTF